ncbi:unnamed protein product [Closterium sp. NIES-54]
MDSLRVLTFDHERRPIQIGTWLNGLQLYILSKSRDNVSLFDHTSGASLAPPATADSVTRSQWLTRDAAARSAIPNHLPLAECTHFGQHKIAKALYDAVVTRYSSPTTAALGRHLLPYLFPKLSAFATVEDLIYHPTSRRVFPSQDVMFDESVPFYYLFPYHSVPPPSPPLFLAPGPPPVDPLPPPLGPTPSSVSQVDTLLGTAPLEVAISSGAARGVASGGAASGGAEPGGAQSEGAGSGGAEPGGLEPGGVQPGVAEPEGVEPGGAEPEGMEPGGAESEGEAYGGAKPRGTASSGVIAGVTAAATSPRGARTRGTGAAGTGGVGGAGAGDPMEPGAARAGGGGAVGAGAGGTGAGAAGVDDSGARGAGGAVRPRLYFVHCLTCLYCDQYIYLHAYTS